MQRPVACPTDTSPRHSGCSRRDDVAMTTEREIQFSLRLDRLAASIEAVEELLRELRAEYDDLTAVQHDHRADDSNPRPEREWPAPGRVGRAIGPPPTPPTPP